MTLSYAEFLAAKGTVATETGFEVEPGLVNACLKPHQNLATRWMVRGGCRALFGAFGLGKTVIQLEAVRLTLEEILRTAEKSSTSGLIDLAGKPDGYQRFCGTGGTGGTCTLPRGLIVAPLGVRQEFMRDARMLGIELRFVRTSEEVAARTADRNVCPTTPIIYLTNYESVRDGKLDATLFDVVSLDEASCLRGFGGTKTFREFMRLFEGTSTYRFVATATPSPNDYIELLAYAAFLGIMDVSQAKTRFFKRDSTKADALTLHPQHAREFWLWVASWALFIQKPSDLGFSDEGYTLPELDVHWHEVKSDHAKAIKEKSGQKRLFADSSLGVVEASTEKRESLSPRVEKMLQLRALDPKAHRLIWHDLEAERHAIEAAIPGVVSVYGSQDLDEREAAIIDFSDGKIQELAAKPVIAGSGCNFQRHCHWAIFLGIGFKFNDFIQAVHRIQRFLQTKRVRIDLIFTEAERKVRHELERKWAQHKEMVEQMSQIIREFGLVRDALKQALNRAEGVERIEVKGEHFTCVHNDCVIETAAMKENSVGLVLTSIPFSNQYEYSTNTADFGHADDNEHFFQQMDYLTPNLLRVLQPGRIAAIHVKDRIVPGGMTGLSFQTVYPFHSRCIDHYTKHGFAYLGMKTIVTDVVRENNQTYRLGWTQQCKDGSKMGVGMPEYLLIFRKPQTDKTRGWADVPVVKDKKQYTRARWQIDAHGFTRSNGDRGLKPEEVVKLKHNEIFQLFKNYHLENVYDFEHHVKIGEALEARSLLPVTFMLLQPPSWSDEVWSDITRMMTLNGSQHAKGKQMHLCPMQFDIADRAINQWSNPGEVIFDPFGGLMTVPYRAVLAGRKGLGCELSLPYFMDGVKYCEAAERELAMPTLFDVA